MVFVDTTNLARLGLEHDRRTGVEASLDQVFDHFLLAVDKDAPACQILEIDAVALAVEPQMNSAVLETFTVEPFSDAGVSQELGGARFEDPRSHAALDVIAAPILEHHRLDAAAMQEVPQQEPCGAGADDGDRSVQGHGLG